MKSIIKKVLFLLSEGKNEFESSLFVDPVEVRKVNEEKGLIHVVKKFETGRRKSIVFDEFGRINGGETVALYPKGIEWDDVLIGEKLLVPVKEAVAIRNGSNPDFSLIRTSSKNNDDFVITKRVSDNAIFIMKSNRNTQSNSVEEIFEIEDGDVVLRQAQHVVKMIPTVFYELI